VGLDQPPANRKTEAEAAGPALLADLDIGFEDAFAILGCDAGPLVGDADLDAGALGRALVEAWQGAGCNFNGPAGRRELDRVDQEIGQNLSEASSIETRSLGAGIDLHPNFQLAVFEQRSKKPHGFVDHGGHASVGDLQYLTSG
jgi:hypothetical protein